MTVISVPSSRPLEPRVAAFIFHYKVYRGWKRLGGDTSYQPPNADVEVHKLTPCQAENGHVPKGLLLIAGWSALGGLLGSASWLCYYIWWEYNLHHATVFAIAAGISVVIFVAYVRFVKYMERP